MGKEIKHGSGPTPVANGCGGHSQSPPLYSHSGTPPRRLSLSVFRFCIEKFTYYESVTNLCTLSFTFGTTCTHKSVLVNNWLFVEFGMLVVVEKMGKCSILCFCSLPTCCSNSGSNRTFSQETPSEPLSDFAPFLHGPALFLLID